MEGDASEIVVNVVIKISMILRKVLIGYSAAINRKDIVGVNILVGMKHLSLDIISLVLEMKNEEINQM